MWVTLSVLTRLSPLISNKFRLVSATITLILCAVFTLSNATTPITSAVMAAKLYVALRLLTLCTRTNTNQPPEVYFDMPIFLAPEPENIDIPLGGNYFNALTRPTYA
jgi:hypothetical protein